MKSHTFLFKIDHFIFKMLTVHSTAKLFNNKQVSLTFFLSVDHSGLPTFFSFYFHVSTFLVKYCCCFLVTKQFFHLTLELFTSKSFSCVVIVLCA